MAGTKFYLALLSLGLFTVVKGMSDSHLRLMEEDSFVRLSCNDELSRATCVPWSTYVGIESVVTNPVVIACGECVEMDLDVDIIELQRGIDVQGKLVFPNGYQVEIITPMIAVQGLLAMFSTKRVDGTPSIIITLVGMEDQIFVPIDENALKCGAGGCATGKKSITVAGGRFFAQGLPNGAKTWTRLYDVTDSTQNPSGITVRSEGVDQMWDVGAEILLTSYTNEWDNHQVRTITNMVSRDGFVDIYLDQPINRPTACVDDMLHDFSVEVALLSRNIVFRGGADTNPDHGGHFWIFKTPDRWQKIDGVEFRNFGQQGTLGRYPIHFHLCGDATGSEITRNTIRESNQRCVVVHATDNLLVQENVAYDTKAHCFVIEDGIETGNRFLFNLGAKTAAPRVIIPNNGANGIETDKKFPSTYWITNLDNTFVSNVAAGSEESGFWWEPLIRGQFASLYDFEPNEVPVRLFKDNVAHSNLKGFRTYPAKALRAPDGRKNHLTGLKAYRNLLDGIFIHLCYNLVVEDSLFADNGKAIDVDRAAQIEIVNTKIIGETPVFRQQYDAQGRDLVPHNCREGMHRGVQLSTFGFQYRDPGVSLEGLLFEGFDDTVCFLGAYPITLDYIVRDGRFWSYATFSNITFNDRIFDPIDFCESSDEGVSVHVSDLDGSLNPSSGLPGSLVSNIEEMLHFVPPGGCTENEERCFSYCEDICFRSISYEVPSTSTEDFSLQVCRSDNPGDCIVTPSYFYVVDPSKLNSSEQFRRFTAHLPPGQYTVAFIDSDGNEVWPISISKQYQDDFQCAGGISDSDVEVYEPPVSEETCTELVKNGDMEEPSNIYFPRYWQFRAWGINLVDSSGMGGSTAVAPRPQGRPDEIIQYLDSRCIHLMEGRAYQLTAHIKLTKDGDPYYCGAQVRERCPWLGIQELSGYTRFLGGTIDEYSTRESDGYVKLTGVVTITRAMVEADNVRLFINTPGEGMAMYVDNVSMRLVGLDGAEPPSPTTPPSIAPQAAQSAPSPDPTPLMPPSPSVTTTPPSIAPQAAQSAPSPGPTSLMPPPTGSLGSTTQEPTSSPIAVTTPPSPPPVTAPVGPALSPTVVAVPPTPPPVPTGTLRESTQLDTLKPTPFSASRQISVWITGLACILANLMLS